MSGLASFEQLRLNGVGVRWCMTPTKLGEKDEPPPMRPPPCPQQQGQCGQTLSRPALKAQEPSAPLLAGSIQGGGARRLVASQWGTPISCTTPRPGPSMQRCLPGPYSAIRNEGPSPPPTFREEARPYWEEATPRARLLPHALQRPQMSLLQPRRPPPFRLGRWWFTVGA